MAVVTTVLGSLRGPWAWNWAEHGTAWGTALMFVGLTSFGYAFGKAARLSQGFVYGSRLKALDASIKRLRENDSPENRTATLFAIVELRKLYQFYGNEGALPEEALSSLSRLTTRSADFKEQAQKIAAAMTTSPPDESWIISRAIKNVTASPACALLEKIPTVPASPQ